jgi:hypothetical protein
MLRIYAHSFVGLLDVLRSVEVQLSIGLQIAPNAVYGPLLSIKENCKALELVSSYKQVKHMFRTFAELEQKNQQIPYAVIVPLMTDLRRRIMEDLEEVVWCQVAQKKTREFYVRVQVSNEPNRTELELRTASELFSPGVVANFGSISKEIEEAAKCSVVNRHTASVFHLMRVMESGLRSLGKTLNDPDLDPKKNPSWESILRKCDLELQKAHDKKIAEWQTDPLFFSTATANVRAVKDAWRNPTMHVEIDYDEERSRDVWNAVRAFMRHLASKLHE